MQITSKIKQLTPLLCTLTLGLTSGLTGTQAQELLVNEDFSRSAKGTLLEQSSESEWQAEQGRLIIGNGRTLNGQALGYAPNRTWANQVYYQDLNAPLVILESVINGKKTQSTLEGAAYYDKSEAAGLVAVAMLVTESSAQAYYDQNGKGEWLAIGKPIATQLTTLDQVQLRYYAMGFWSAMDDLKVAIGKPGE